MSVLEVTNLTKNFGGIKAVNDVSLNIEMGEIIGLIGPNGAGKTTLFNLLTGIYAPTSGQIEYNLNTKVKTKDLKPHKMIHYGVSRTFQNIRLFKDMSVLDNVLLGFHSLLFKSSILKKDSLDEAYELLERFNLLDKRDNLAKNLAYGDQRRLEIARTLASKPMILLLDEPAAGMNPKETKELKDLIFWIRNEYHLTIILIEHDMSLVMNICERIFVFDYGNLVAGGTPKEIQNNKRVIKAYLGEEAV